MSFDLSAGIKTFTWSSLPPGWQFDLLGNRCNVRRGASPRPAGDPRYFGGQIPWFKIGDATRVGGRFLVHTQEFVNETGASHSVRVPPGSLLVSNSGVSLGFAIINKVEGCIHDGWLFLSDFRDADRDYLYYAINYFTKGIRNIADGTTQPNLNTDIARRLILPFPRLSEQRRISDLLGTLDDRIDLNRRMNRTLEAIARAIFKSWFVSFDSVRSAGLVDSVLGLIPKGWSVAELRDHVEVAKGLSYKGAGLSSRGLFLHNLNSIYEGGGYKYSGIKFYVGEYKERHRIRTGDIIVANTEQGHDYLLIGYPAIVPRRFGSLGLFSHHLFRVRTREDSPLRRYFLYYLLMTPAVREQVIGCTNGTTVNMLASDGLAIPRFALPPATLIEKFETLAAPIHELMEQNVEAIQNLVSLRDLLLPKLMAGAIRTKSREVIVEANA